MYVADSIIKDDTDKDKQSFVLSAVAAQFHIVSKLHPKVGYYHRRYFLSSLLPLSATVAVIVVSRLELFFLLK